MTVAPRLLRVVAALLLPCSVCAVELPHRPVADDTVLLQRPAGAAKAVRESRRAATGMAPQLRIAAVQAAIDTAHRTGDPRYFGQAQAMLGDAWTAEAPEPRLRLLRAVLLQQRHDFARALSDLDAVVAADPGNVQARLVRANVHMVQGEPQRARADCAALIGRSGFLVTATCIGGVSALTGQAATGQQAIEMALQREPEASPALKAWALTQAAEIAERLGDVPAATEHYATASAIAAAAGENDVYLKAAQADFWLDHNRAVEVRAALLGETAADPLLLRLAMAEAQLAAAGDAEAGQAMATQWRELQDRFALAANRGDPPHRREQAMATLHLQGDAHAALKLAEQSWHEQKEPADARLLMLAALAAKEPARAQPALDWYERTGIEDVRLRPLVQRLHGETSQPRKAQP